MRCGAELASIALSRRYGKDVSIRMTMLFATKTICFICFPCDPLHQILGRMFCACVRGGRCCPCKKEDKHWLLDSRGTCRCHGFHGGDDDGLAGAGRACVCLDT